MPEDIGRIAEKCPGFDRLYLKNRNIMMYTAMQILNNSADAEDCVSEAFLRAFKIYDKISSLDCPKQTSLLVIIVRNIAIDTYRKNKRSFAAEEELIMSEKISFDSYPVYSVIVSIKKLKSEYSDILMLKYVYGYTTAEIAAMLAITADNAEKRIQRARAALRKQLDYEEKEGDING